MNEKETEAKIQNDIQIQCNSKTTTLWRNDTGTCFRGKATRMKDAMIISHPQTISYGLCKGSSDLIGYDEVIITPDMVGKKVAVFTVIEVKKLGGIVSPEQKRFIEVIKAAGGKAGVAHSVSEAKRIISGH